MLNQESSRAAYLQWLFLSNEGRVPRSTYWGASIGTFMALVIVLLLCRVIAGNNPSDGMRAVGAIIYLGFCLANLCLTVKRLHDADFSGFFVVLGFIPYVGWLFIFIVAGCWPGTPGTNEYGKDPFAPTEEESGVPHAISVPPMDNADAPYDRGPI